MNDDTYVTVSIDCDSSFTLQDTALHVAAQYGHSNMVLLLLDDKTTKFSLNKDGCHFLDIAISTGNKHVAIAILSHDR